MKRCRKRRKPSLQPQVILVGNSGRICQDNRLCRLRMTKKYKNFLMEQEKEKNAKISEMSKLVEQYENLSCVIHNLNQENADNSNADLLQELKEMQTKYRERLLHLESTFMDRIPDALNRSVREILNCCSKFNKQKRAIRSGLPRKEKRELKHSTISHGDVNLYGVSKMSPTDLMNSRPINKSNQKTNTSPISEMKSNESVVTRNSWSGCYKSQIFVRKSNLQLQAINIDLFSVGNNLYDVLAQELEEDVTKYNLIFGAKEVDKEKTLFKQEIYHGSTVDLILPLYGGMPEVGKKKKRHKRPKKNKEATLKQDKEHSMEETSKAEKVPEAWTDPTVQRWFEMLEIDIHLVSTLKTLDGNQVNKLEKEDWRKMFPSYGHILFNMWQKDQRTSAETVGTEAYHEEERTLFTPLDEGTKEVSDGSNDPNDSRPNVDSQEQDTSNSSRKVLFGKVEALDGIGKSLLLEDFENDDKSSISHFGSVITVTGVCLSSPHIQENIVTLFIRDDPQGAVSFYNKIKIDIARCESNQHEIDILLKEVNTNMHVGVKGRVEKLDKKDDVVNKDGCKMLKFKLVIDSDDHALFSVETKSPKLKRQLSQCWWPLQAGSENANELNLKVGDFIVDNDLERVYCDADTSDEIILRYVVAFKNSFDGEVFVGVKKNGEIAGKVVSNGEIKKWCERLTNAIGNLLPQANEGADICRNIQEANELVHRKRCFVCVLPLCDDSSRALGWIHVPKGEACKVYFTKASDVHAFQRIGAQNKRITNYEHLFYDLESLASRKIEPVFEEDYDEEDDAQNEEKCTSQKGKQEYRVLDKVNNENQHHELKMIWGENPVKTILEKYLAPYSCGFLNSDGGNIFFGIEEDEQSKMGHIVGIVLSTEERKELVETTVKTLRKFYPPVCRSQFDIKFHSVRVSSELIVKDKGGGKLYTVITGPSDEIGKKWPKFVHNKLPAGSRSTVIPIRSQRFCAVATKQTSASVNLTELVEQFVKENSKFKLQTISETDLNIILKTIYVIELNVRRSPYPINMIKTIDTHVFSKNREKQLCTSKLSVEDLMCRFKLDSTIQFNVDTFLKDVKKFDNAGNSYIMVASPFDLHEQERDLFGLVIPKWTLTIDLDQEPKQSGHLYQLFQKLNDRYQPKRGRFLKTPHDSKLDLNREHAVCWLVARGYREDEKSLSGESHAKWNKTHRSRVRELLSVDLEASVKPNCLNVVVLWDEGHQALVESLRTILEDIISLNGDDSTVITFVCATPKASSDISRKIIAPLQEDNLDTISEDRVYVAPPYVLARFLSLKLPSPYRPEDDYQVPHKKSFPYAGSQIIPQILPQQLRQNLEGYIEVMYMKKRSKVHEQTLNEERRNFFSGSAITNDGLHGSIAIRRTRMDDLERKFKALSCDKKSNVSLIFVRVDRGAGSTTMCLQFLYEQHRSYPCAQLIEIKDGLVSHIEEINKKTRLPLILFVDENIAHLQEFLDFKKKVERRNVNVIFILIEPSEVFSVSESLPSRKARTKSARDSSLYGPSPYKVVQLERTLDNDEMEQLVKVLAVLAKEKKNELLKFKDKARKDKNNPPTFAHFSLLAFGSEFKGLKQYVKFRLTLADERQQNILAFFSLTHVFTNYSLPANALVRFLDKSNVILEEELEDKYLQELLSPRADDSDSRRISFHGVACEILKQLSLKQLSATSSSAKSEDDPYWKYIKYVSVTMAKHVLSKYITTRKIDRLTRKLFVTSEYESEKFSQLIRTMKVKNPDTARDTLKELVDVFNGTERHSSMRAHLRARLAKYYMIQYKDFAEAKKLIEAAIDEQEQDSFLHHIHGDIIRLYVQVLVEKMKTKEDMEIILSYAEQSSKCFEFVRSKKPHMSHGYISDAIVRITVMQAGIKLMGGKNISFVDYLIKRINEIKESDDEDISPNSRYLLSLISDAHEYLDERCIDFEQKKHWKETFLDCIGDLKNLTWLCDKIGQEKNCSSFINCSAWLHEILLQTQILHNALEIESKVLSPEEIESKLIKMEEYDSHSKFGDRFMKFWIRYSRQRLSVPNLQEVMRRVYEWSNKMKKRRVASPQAEFYK
ncbi:Divergent AAA region [Paramuricea clavata]|uniref:Divergent AAA region n=1 Tax=Paramuricea clavata TaxID=317549 RepID=A0A6S7H3C9_PARCT|nr:Divergent AAA region [Paramuricea clavata]